MLDRETNKMKSETDGIANAQQERANRDIRDEQVVLRAEQDRITTLESIKEWGRVVGDGVSIIPRSLRLHPPTVPAYQALWPPSPIW